VLFEDIVDGHTQVFVVGADGRGVRQVTRLTGQLKHPVSSPDGSRIAFERDLPGGDEVDVADAGGTHVHRVSRSLFAETPAFSPDGRQLAFGYGDGAHYGLALAPIAGGAVRKLTRHKARPETSGREFGDNNPRFTPDGHRIVFTRLSGDKSAIFVIGVDGRGLRRVTDGSRHEDAARVSPDGRLLAYGINATGTPGPGQAGEIFIENLRNHHATRFTRGFGSGTAGSFMGAWSPDGRSIAFASDRSGTWQIYVEPVDGSDATSVTPHATEAHHADWGP
jgi:TolB protein